MNQTVMIFGIASLLWLFPAFSGAADEAASVPDLGARIAEFQSKRSAPDPRKQAIMDRAAVTIAEGLPDPGLKVGTHAPDFSLPDPFGEQIRLSEQLAEGPVILVFYRGAWCPYCNMQLHALKESLPQFQRYGAQLIAVTPQTPDRSLGQVKKDAYPFHILSDLDNRVMQAYRLYYDLPEELKKLYLEDFDLDLAKYNGKGRYGLPVPGTFIIDRQGMIRAAYTDIDYKKRMEPADIIEALVDIESAAAR